MADLTISGTTVRPQSGGTPQITQKTAGEACSAGNYCYASPVSGNYVYNYANTLSGYLNSIDEGGIALNNAAAGQVIQLFQAGPLALTCISASGVPGPVVAEIYCGSTNAGGIAPITDLASGNQTKILGYCNASGYLTVAQYPFDGLRPNAVT